MAKLKQRKAPVAPATQAAAPAQTTTTVPTRKLAPARHGGSPVPKILLGLALILFFGMGSILHIQTSEAFFLGGHAVGLFAPRWSIVAQPVQFVQGTLSPRMAEAVMWGWGIELVFLICVVGFEVAHESVAAASTRMASLFRTGTLVLVIFDGYTDFQYGNVASGFWGQLGFACITAFVVFYFGIVGWRLIEQGLREWGR
jgi:hypothetical protein